MGSDGEIRGGGAVGRGSKPKAGLAGFNVFDLLITGYQQPWELSAGRPHHTANPLDIMLEALIGSAVFNNEFGRLYHGLFPDSCVPNKDVTGLQRWLWPKRLLLPTRWHSRPSCPPSRGGFRRRLLLLILLLLRRNKEGVLERKS